MAKAIHGYWDQRLTQLSRSVIDELNLVADRDFAKRSIPGSIIILVAYLVCSLFTDIDSDRPQLYYLLLLLLAASAASRLFILRALKYKTAETIASWERVFSVAVMVTSVSWGIFISVYYLQYGVTTESVVILLMTVGIAGGAAVATFIWKRLCQTYLAVLLLIPAVTILSTHASPIAYALDFSLVVYYLFLYFQIERSNGEYWDALINTKLLELQTEELAAAKQNAENANSAKSSFLANMSHELRTPLNAILGFSQIMQDDETLDASHRDHVREINLAGDHLLNLINQILDLSKIEEGHLQLESRSFDLPATLREIENILLPSAQAKGVELKVEIAADCPRHVIGDELRLKQVLMNLVGNAVKFSRDGEVKVQVTPQETGHYQFLVQDNGIGIDPEVLPTLFKPFTQADISTTRKYGGTGLGLTISRELVKAMGGEIEVESTLGEGARFWFRIPLPIAEESDANLEVPATPVKESAEVSSTPVKSAHILLVEDNRVNQMVAKKILETMGLHVTTAANGAEALEHQGNSYDLIFMDMQMPVMDGYEATRKIRESESGTGQHRTIVAMTANAMAGDRQRCLEAGMDDYISKPLKVDELKRLIAKWLQAD